MAEASLDTTKNISDNTKSPLSLRHTIRGHTDYINSIAWSPFLHGFVYADSKREEDYLSTLFGLVLTLYAIPFDDPLIRNLRQKLQYESEQQTTGKTR